MSNKKNNKKNKALEDKIKQLVTNYCPDCNSEYKIHDPIGAGLYSRITILHDDTCPTYARMK